MQLGLFLGAKGGDTVSASGDAERGPLHWGVAFRIYIRDGCSRELYLQPAWVLRYDSPEQYRNLSLLIRCLFRLGQTAVAAETLLEAVDVSFYACASGGGCRLLLLLLCVENDLRTAIEKQQLSIHYQPVIDLKNNRV